MYESTHQYQYRLLSIANTILSVAHLWHSLLVIVSVLILNLLLISYQLFLYRTLVIFLEAIPVKEGFAIVCYWRHTILYT